MSDQLDSVDGAMRIGFALGVMIVLSIELVTYAAIMVIRALNPNQPEEPRT